MNDETNKESPQKTVAIIVTYFPSFDSLLQTLEVLSEQVNHIIIVDNNSGQSFLGLKEICSKCSIIKLTENLGIAHAQNIGIQEAIKFSPVNLLFLDQDSTPESQLVIKLQKHLLDPSVAAVGPSYIDTRTRRPSFFVITNNKGKPLRWYPNEKTNLDCGVDVAFIISSGTLLKVEALLNIGYMRSNYFIDHVDTEWCFRAFSKGYRILGVPSAVIYHSLGDDVKEVWFFGKRQVSYHSPLRDYYMFRNTLLMLRDVELNFYWRLHLIGRLIQFASYFLLFAGGRRERLGRILLGVWHGFKNVRGKLETSNNICKDINESTFNL